MGESSWVEEGGGRAGGLDLSGREGQMGGRGDPVGVDHTLVENRKQKKVAGKGVVVLPGINTGWMIQGQVAAKAYKKQRGRDGWLSESGKIRAGVGKSWVLHVAEGCPILGTEADREKWLGCQGLKAQWGWRLAAPCKSGPG